jgi:hypothetical protein
VAVPSITDNSPQLGDIAWGPFTIQYNGVGYQIGAGSTSQRWVWWRYAINTIEAGPDLPADLTDDDLVLFGNKNGIGIRIQASTLVDGELVVDGSILARAVSAEILVANEIFSREGYFGIVQAEQLQSGSISAALGLLGSLAVGNITITPQKGIPGEPGYDPGGIVIPLTGGGVIQLPADGSMALVEAILKTRDLTVDGGLTINGLTNAINGKLLLGSGTPDPTAPTGIGSAMFNKVLGKLNVSGNDVGYSNWSRGLAKTTNGHLATIMPISSEGQKKLLVFDPTTKQVVGEAHSDPEVLNFMGVTAVGNLLYVVGWRWNATAGVNQARIHVYNTSGVFQNGRWIEYEDGNRFSQGTYYGCAIAADPDGTHVWVQRVQANGKQKFFQYTLASAAPTDWLLTDGTVPDCTFCSGAFYVGNADFGVGGGFKRFLVGGQFAGNFTQMSIDFNTGLEVLSEGFGTNYVDGLIWDGTQFVTLDQDTTGMYMSTLSPTKVDTVVYAQHEWASASGKRSKASPANSGTIPRRKWPMLTLPAPPRTGSGTDVADRVNVYLDTLATPKRLQQLVNPATATTLIAAAMAGAGPETPATVTQFVAADSSGAIESVGVDSATGLPLINVKGDGLAPRIKNLRMVRPQLRRSRDTTQTYAVETWEAHNYPIEGKNEGFTITTNATFTIVRPGEYDVYVHTTWDATAVARRLVDAIAVNGNKVARAELAAPAGNNNHSRGHTNSVRRTLSLVAGDTINAYGWQSGGSTTSALNTLGDTGTEHQTYIEITYVGETV